MKNIKIAVNTGDNENEEIPTPEEKEILGIKREIKNEREQGIVFLITINSPLNEVNHDGNTVQPFTHERIFQLLSELSSVQYVAMCDEIGTNHHTHILVVGKSYIHFKTFKKRFPTAHIDRVFYKDFHKAIDTCIAYLKKEGERYADKAETSIEGTFEEFGEIPEENAIASWQEQVLNYIEQGMSTIEILKILPQQIMNVDKINRLRKQYMIDMMTDNPFPKVIHYVFGDDINKCIAYCYGLVKDRVYRADLTLRNPWDEYSGENIIFLTYFLNYITIKDLLRITNDYASKVNSRYYNGLLISDTFYLISDIPFEHFFKKERIAYPYEWDILCERIKTVTIVPKDGKVARFNSIQEYAERI